MNFITIACLGLEDDEAGVAAAWLLGAANATVLLSLGLKAAARWLPVSAAIRERILRFNLAQKRWLMPAHYVGNLVALGFACLHFLLASCRAVLLPETGLLIMAALCATGVMVKFKLWPKILKGLYLVHAHPASFTSLVLLLIVGHVLADEGMAWVKVITAIRHTLID
jgi:hypothetical protein